MRTTPNLDLTVWDDNNDTFDHTALAANWDAIDADYTRTRPANQVQVLTSVPGSSNFEGRLVYLSAAASGFAAGTVIRYTSGSFRPVAGVELLSAVPSSSNFAGRLVLLSSADSGFAQWSLIRYDGSAWALTNHTYELLAAVPGSGNYAGRVVLLTSADSGFAAFQMIRYDGSAWALIGPNPVPPATELNYFASTTAITTTNTASPGDTIQTFSATTYENTKYYLHINIPFLSHSAVSSLMTFALYESTTLRGFATAQTSTTIGQGTHLDLYIPYTPTAGSHTFKVNWLTGGAGTATIGAASTYGASIFRIIKA